MFILPNIYLTEFYSTNPSTTITKTMRDGADAETVVCALFHDVGEVLNHVNHGEIGETLIIIW